MTPTRSLLTAAAVLSVAAVPAAWAAGPGAWTDGAAAAPMIPTPLRVTGAPTPDVATPLTLDGEVYARLRQARQVVVIGFHLDEATRVDLDLERFEIFTPDARIVRASANGEVPMAPPDVVLLRGTVVGQPGSSVFLGLSPYGTNGVIRTAGGRHIISSGRFGADLSTVIYDVEAVPEGTIELRGFECGLDRLAGFEPAVPAAGGAAAGDPPECSEAVEIAVETDWEFTGDVFEGDVEASTAYAAELIAAVAEIYLRDVEVTLLISFLRIWADENDPWPDDDPEGFGGIALLYLFQAEYDGSLSEPVERHTAHFLSGRSPSDIGGVAFLPGLCQGEWAYGLSAHLQGSFPYPLEDNDADNWDVVVVAHELGHNFAAPHTHAMSPPVDECAYGDCTNAVQGTIMSYCHLCDGGIANIRLMFHQRVIEEEILAYLEGGLNGIPCQLAAAEVNITLHPQDATVCAGESVEFSASAEGEPPLFYQWRKNGLDIGGATGATYVIAAVTPGDAGIYDVLVTNDCGNAASDPAWLDVDDCPTPCIWDLDDSGSVGIGDFLIMLATWGQVGVPADFDGGGVGVTDFLILLGHWGPCPP